MMITLMTRSIDQCMFLSFAVTSNMERFFIVFPIHALPSLKTANT